MTNKIKIGFYTMAKWGYGDVIFTIKLYNLFKKWYGITPYIICPSPEKFILNGIPKSKVLKFYSDDPYSDLYVDLKPLNITTINNSQFKYKFDAIFVTPVVSDYIENFSFFKALFPYITKDTLYRFSAYDHTGQKYEIPMGLSSGRLGIFINKCKGRSKRFIKNPYIMTHVSDTGFKEPEYDYISCFSNFIKLMVKKYYKKYTVLDIIIPKFVTKHPRFKVLKKYIKKYYQDVKVIKKSNHKLLENGINFRCDLPFLTHYKYTQLYQHCLPDVLLTGNQSVSDVISCYRNFNIYYQTLPWEVKFAKNLGVLLDKPYLKKRQSACGEYGNKKMLLLKTDSKIIQQKYNFEKKGKKLIDSIIKKIIKINKHN